MLAEDVIVVPNWQKCRPAPDDGSDDQLLVRCTCTPAGFLRKARSVADIHTSYR